MTSYLRSEEICVTTWLTVRLENKGKHSPFILELVLFQSYSRIEAAALYVRTWPRLRS